MFYVEFQAYHLELKPPNYVWIGPGWFQSHWWKISTDQDIQFGECRCNNSILKEMIEGYFSTNPQAISDSKDTLTSGFVSRNRLN